MDLVKARKKAKEAGKEERKDLAPALPSAPAVPAASAPAGPLPSSMAERARPSAPPESPAPARKPAVKKPPAPPRVEPASEDIFLDSAFGEDLPPTGGFDAEEDKSRVIAPTPSHPAKPAARAEAKSAARKAPAPADEDAAWEEEFNRLQKAAEREEREKKTGEAKAKAPAHADQPAPKPGPPKKVREPKKKPIIPFKAGEDWPVAERRDPPARTEAVGEGAPLFPGGAEDDDFFSLVTEELYMHEFNRTPDAETGAQLELLSFRLGQELYAVRLTSIRQIIKLLPVTMVPRAPDYILGILSLRGTIIPVFDLRRRLLQGTTVPTRKSRIIVVSEGRFMVGMVVDEVLQVVRLAEASLEPSPSMLAAVESEYIEGIGRTQNRMLILLALGKIMAPVNGSNR